MNSFILVFLGGGLGSVCRYTIQIFISNKHTITTFPIATFTANIIGSLLIGLFYSLSAKTNLPPDIRLLLTTGFCGGFTTFSTFSNDSLALLKSGEQTTFLIYVISSIILGLAAVFAGNWIGSKFL